MISISVRRPSVLVAASLVLAIGVTGCATKKPKPTLRYEERPVELLFSTGADRLDHQRWSEAVDYFEEVERQHPYSEWSRQAILMSAYAHYQGNQYAEAIGDADRFVSLYPGNRSVPYAYYLKAVCYFEQIVDVGRDQAYTESALAALRDVTIRFPRTEYAADARLKIDMVNDQLAGKEMTIGRYYLREGQPLAAVGRFKTVIDRYQTTSHTPEALYRLVEAYMTIGLLAEAQRNGAILGHNFPGDPWYRDAYNLLTDRGLRPAEPPLESGAKKSMLERLLISKADTPAPPAVAPVVDAGAPSAAPAPVAAPSKPEKKGFLHRLFRL